MIRQIAVAGLATLLTQSPAWSQETLPPVDPGLEGTEGDVIKQSPPRPPEDEQPAVQRESPLKGFYAGIAFGPVFYRDNSIGNVDIDYESGGQLNILAGAFLGPLRPEIELSSQYAEFDPDNSQFDGDFDVFRATVSLYFDVATIDVSWIKGGLTPYLGGGLGIAVADIEGFNDDDTGFTYHGEFGVNIPVFRQLSVVPAYRYERSDFDEFDDDTEAHTIRAGVRYTF